MIVHQEHQRAKSCETSNRKVQKIKSEHVKSASSSPIIKKQQQNQANSVVDPSTLSISTEWEFEAQDEDNGNSCLIDKVNHT